MSYTKPIDHASSPFRGAFFCGFVVAHVMSCHVMSCRIGGLAGLRPLRRSRSRIRSCSCCRRGRRRIHRILLAVLRLLLFSFKDEPEIIKAIRRHEIPVVRWGRISTAVSPLGDFVTKTETTRKKRKTEKETLPIHATREILPCQLPARLVVDAADAAQTLEIRRDHGLALAFESAGSVSTWFEATAGDRRLMVDGQEGGRDQGVPSWSRGKLPRCGLEGMRDPCQHTLGDRMRLEQLVSGHTGLVCCWTRRRRARRSS